MKQRGWRHATRTGVADVALRAAKRISVRHRRWRRLLASLDLDPDALPQPVAAPSERDFIICGSPRSGTTLLCAALFQPPQVVTVMEPWDGLRLPPDVLFASLRTEIEGDGRLARGRLDIDALRDQAAVRWVREQNTAYDVDVSPGWQLGVKWPAFWRYLDLLPETRFLVCVRHPHEVVTSYRLKGGALGDGLDYDVAFNRQMNDHLRAAADDPLVRQVLLYDHINFKVLEHAGRPNVLVVRYERWASEPEALIDEIGIFLGLDLGMPVKLRPGRSPERLDAATTAMVRRRCRSAEHLGYGLEPQSQPA